jgi:transcriptional regulator with XRE-family HTH domain
MPTKKKPTWAMKLEDLLRELNLTQAGLAAQLDVSPMTVSRWVRGTHRPTAATYIRLAALAEPPGDTYFLEQAGLSGPNVLRAQAPTTPQSAQVKLTSMRLVAPRQLTSGSAASYADAVAIPILEKPATSTAADDVTSAPALDPNRAADIFTVPARWCDDPGSMIGIANSGDSMAPLIPDGAILFVDTAHSRREQLNRRIVLATHRDQGFKVAWLQRIGATDFLFSENTLYPPTELSGKSHWNLLGEVLWWISSAPKR